MHPGGLGEYRLFVLTVAALAAILLLGLWRAGAFG